MTATDDSDFQTALDRLRDGFEESEPSANREWEGLSAALSTAIAAQRPGLAAVQTIAENNLGFDDWENRRLDLSEELARHDYGNALVEAAWAYFRRTAPVGLQTYFKTDHHPWGALVKWFLKSNPEHRN